MPARNARINVVLEKPLYAAVDEIARRKGLSRSMVIRDLIKDALEIQEDLALSAFAEHREKSLGTGKTLSHDDTWS